MTDTNEEQGIAIDSLLNAPHVAAMIEKNVQLSANCRVRFVDSLRKEVIGKVESIGRKDELNQLVENCFRYRHGAHVLGAESVYEADGQLYAFLDKIFYNSFSERALSQSLDSIYQRALCASYIWRELPLAVGAVETGASAEPSV